MLGFALSKMMGHRVGPYLGQDKIGNPSPMMVFIINRYLFNCTFWKIEKKKKRENLWMAGAWRVSRGVVAAGSVGGADGSGKGRKER